MKVYDVLRSKNIDELADWLDRHTGYDCAVWTEWFGHKYCDNCEAEIVFAPYLNKNIECSWCELNKRCRFFQELPEIPDNKQTIKLWLESEG